MNHEVVTIVSSRSSFWLFPIPEKRRDPVQVKTISKKERTKVQQRATHQQEPCAFSERSNRFFMKRQMPQTTPPSLPVLYPPGYRGHEFVRFRIVQMQCEEVEMK